MDSVDFTRDQLRLGRGEWRDLLKSRGLVMSELPGEVRAARRRERSCVYASNQRKRHVSAVQVLQAQLVLANRRIEELEDENESLRAQRAEMAGFV